MPVSMNDSGVSPAPVVEPPRLRSGWAWFGVVAVLVVGCLAWWAFLGFALLLSALPGTLYGPWVTVVLLGLPLVPIWFALRRAGRARWFVIVPALAVVGTTIWMSTTLPVGLDRVTLVADDLPLPTGAVLVYSDSTDTCFGHCPRVSRDYGVTDRLKARDEVELAAQAKGWRRVGDDHWCRGRFGFYLRESRVGVDAGTSYEDFPDVTETLAYTVGEC